ncbi:hypothetical protein EMIHUDRAFT_101294 [Emiliania huxleyi CCMP1516]|uniref:COMM domain-containing protein n=2 Tax=Emiliania huxleyi TaxID=2903 RepID=A0A0D3JF31_EMIH1|nr:hypothetical protein EMIHUDRAFT_101294 [Emiliania huxleyi CCMP1516]EOD22116.1 hypothetical protein EMIHUDRAFT_101294 [Emiliania huxleyi CCMP1516]|eukprot:XP_005774545.1 hypothetical protein EMIHUDRAFT_101294 [Emiliania huxleyi CCMP1516]
MGAEESKPAAPPGEVSERINSVELSELRVAFSTLAPDGALTAEALTSALPPVLPWEELHRVLLEAVAARGHPGGGLGFDAFVLGLALTVRSRQSARQRMGLLRSLYAGGDRDGPLGADRLTALLSGAMRASGGGAGDDTALGAAVADAAELPAAEWDRWAADQLPALGTAFETSVIEALCAVGRAFVDSAWKPTDKLSWLHSDTTYAPHESRRLAEGARRVAAVEAGSLTLETRKKMAGGDAATRFVLSAAGAHDFKGEELKASEERLARERGHE